MLLIAHRGAMDEAPENTRAAFKAAALYPIHGFEFDVQLTRDHVPVVFHDETLRRINGQKFPVAAYAYETLARMDWGKWFGPSFAGEPLLTVAELLATYGQDKRLFIEIKSYPADKRSNRSERLADLVVQLLHEHVPAENRDSHAILSFDADLLAYCAQKAPGLNYVLNLEDVEVKEFPSRSYPAHLQGLCVSINVFSREFADYVHGHGGTVMTYSCNNPGQTGHALECGADVLMTDSPGWLTKYMEKTI